MRYIKNFETKGISDDFDINVGDTLYCINNNGCEQDLTIGKAYTVDQVDDRNPYNVIFHIVETESRWMSYRFSKDPNHINIVKHNAKQYNL